MNCVFLDSLASVSYVSSASKMAALSADFPSLMWNISLTQFSFHMIIQYCLLWAKFDVFSIVFLFFSIHFLRPLLPYWRNALSTVQWNRHRYFCIVFFLFWFFFFIVWFLVTSLFWVIPFFWFIGYFSRVLANILPVNPLDDFKCG